jgi:hypothetical protein
MRRNPGIAMGFRRTSTGAFSPGVRIFAEFPVILRPQILGWLSSARSTQEFGEKVLSAQTCLRIIPAPT